MSSVTLMHPAKAVGQNEMPFGRGTRVVPRNIALDRGPGPPIEREEFKGQNSSSQRCHLLPNYSGPCSLIPVERRATKSYHTHHNLSSSLMLAHLQHNINNITSAFIFV